MSDQLKNMRKRTITKENDIFFGGGGGRKYFRNKKRSKGINIKSWSARFACLIPCLTQK